MQWDDEAIVLGARLFSETGLIVDVLTRERGRRSGLVHGGASRSKRAQFEPGNTLQVSWTARLDDQLGRFAMAEAKRERAAHVLEDAARLCAIAAVASLLREALHEGDVHGGLYPATTLLLDEIAAGEVWPALYVRWEIGLLAALGYGLDLERCALSGINDGLTHVSPRTGRAVQGSQAGAYLDRLLPLPAFLVGGRMLPTAHDIAQGLRLTGHFLEHRLFADVHKPVPEARARLVERMGLTD